MFIEKLNIFFFSMSLLHCQSSYYTDFHTVAGLITTRYSTLTKLSMRLIDQIQPTLYFSVNNEEASRFSKGSRVTHVTVCCIPSRKNNCLPVMAQRENRIFVNKCYIYKSLFFPLCEQPRAAKCSLNLDRF